VAEIEGLPETVAESSTEGDPLDVGVWEGEASTVGVAHADANGEAVAAVVPVGGGELEAPMVRVPVDAKDGDSRAEMLAELETVRRTVGEPERTPEPESKPVLVGDAETELEVELVTVVESAPLAEGEPEGVLLR
jgi:hypothetical protein